MSNDLRAVLAVGTRLAYDGQRWQVTELDGAHVLLSGPAGGIRRVSAGHLLADPGTRLDDAPGDPVDGSGAYLAGLGETELAELRARVAHIQEVRTGFRRGCQELAMDGEPRPDYAPGVPMLARYAAKAKETGAGVSTLRRWARDFGEHGPAGLADQRWRRRRPPLSGADPRWLEMARRVLGEHTEAGKPTQDLILAEVAARLGAEHGDGTAPVPAPTGARLLLREISKGTSAFGGTRAKREIAGRPAAPYGRLRAMRPGEYLLLDTTRLDVFAMDPVTLRWVQAELSAAMDLYDRCVTGLRLTPVSTKAVDAAAVLFESIRPLPEPAAGQA
ncbi:MAG: hypothetical protein ACRDMI_18610, partial [Streptosporangiaceae bacterium]